MNNLTSKKQSEKKYEGSIEENHEKSNILAKKAEEQSKKPCVFMSHEWGENGEDHEKSKILARKLEEFGYHVWLDEKELKTGDLLLPEISDAIQQSICVLIVVTKGYQDKVNQKSFNYCSFEFENTIRNFHGRVIPIVTDARMLNLTWPYPFGYLQRTLFEDFTDASLFSGPVNDFNHPLHLKCSRLAHRIRSNDPVDPSLKPLTIDDIRYDEASICNRNHKTIYYDQDQNRLLCLYCHGNYHQKQNSCCCQSITVAKEEFENQFSSLRLQTFSSMDKIKKSRIDIDTMISSLDAEKSKELAGLSNVFDEMRSLLDERENQLKSDVLALCESKINTLSSQKQFLDGQHDNLAKEIYNAEKTKTQSEMLFILSYLSLKNHLTRLQNTSFEENLLPQSDNTLSVSCKEDSLSKMISGAIRSCLVVFTPEQEKRFKSLQTLLKQVMQVETLQYDCFHPQISSLFSEGLITPDRFIDIFFGTYLEDLIELFQAISKDPIPMIIFRNYFFRRKIRVVPNLHPLLLAREPNTKQKVLNWEDGNLMVTYDFPNIENHLQAADIAQSLQLPPVWSSFPSPTTITDQTQFEKCSIDHLTGYTLSFWLKFEVTTKEERSCFLHSEESWRYLETGKRIIYMGIRGEKPSCELIFFDAIHSKSKNFRKNKFVVGDTSLLVTKEWVHITVTRDKDDFSFYLNGENVPFSLEEVLINGDVAFQVPKGTKDKLSITKLAFIRASCNSAIAREMYQLGF